MTEQLPVISSAKNITTAKQSSATMLGRGLAAIQSSKAKVAFAASKQDKLYREVRDSYDLIANDGSSRHFKNLETPIQNPLLDSMKSAQTSTYVIFMKQLENIFAVFQQLADQGFAKAYFPLALMNQGGQGISIDIEKANYYSQLAFDWCISNQTSNDPEIWTDLGLMYDGGVGVKEDKAQAVFWYRKAAENGYPKAKVALGFMYDIGFGVGRCTEKARIWFREAAEQGYPRAQFHLGFSYLDGDQDHLALFWLSKAVDNGYPGAACTLGSMYENGWGVEQDTKQATFWYHQAATQGVEEAQWCLATLLSRDRPDFERDDNLALFWYSESANQGDSWAQFKLGLIYEKTPKVENNVEIAISWYLESAKNGNNDAQKRLTELGINYY